LIKAWGRPEEEVSDVELDKAWGRPDEEVSDVELDMLILIRHAILRT